MIKGLQPFLLSVLCLPVSFVHQVNADGYGYLIKSGPAATVIGTPEELRAMFSC